MNTHTKTWALVAMIAALAGCGGNAVEGQGGSGGSGGSGGAGGGSGGGGATGPACSEAQKTAALEPAPSLGFQGAIGAPKLVVLSEVTATSMKLSVGPDAPLITFEWEGPPLTDLFTNGDSATAGQTEDWHFVAGDKVVAVYDATGLAAPPSAINAVPMSSSPALSYITSCVFPDEKGYCGLPARDVESLGVQMDADGASVIAGSGETQSVGDWTLHNAVSVAFPGYSSNDCVAEAGLTSSFTVTGPATP